MLHGHVNTGSPVSTSRTHSAEQAPSSSSSPGSLFCREHQVVICLGKMDSLLGFLALSKDLASRVKLGHEQSRAETAVVHVYLSGCRKLHQTVKAQESCESARIALGKLSVYLQPSLTNRQHQYCCGCTKHRRSCAVVTPVKAMRIAC